MNLKNWLFRDRSWTVKTYASINTGEVRIYEKSTSPFTIAVQWVVALVVLSLAAAGIYRVFISPPPDTVELISLVISLTLWSLPSMLTIGLINKGVRAWYRRHFIATGCDQCNDSTTYEHVFNEHHDLAEHRKNNFCSPECREDWERENITYDFSGYYDIQCESDKERVQRENYSSSYYVEGEASLQTD